MMMMMMMIMMSLFDGIGQHWYPMLCICSAHSRTAGFEEQGCLYCTVRVLKAHILSVISAAEHFIQYLM